MDVCVWGAFGVGRPSNEFRYLDRSWLQGAGLSHASRHALTPRHGVSMDRRMRGGAHARRQLQRHLYVVSLL